jgi:uroporphyrinogen decarboxylase
MTIMDEHRRKGESLVEETRRKGGLAPLDVERFWADEAIASANPFGKDIPQLPLGIRMSWECVFAELGIPEDAWRFQNDPAWALGLVRAYNDEAEGIVGRRLLDETPRPDASRVHPKVKDLADVFEAKSAWQAGSWWLEPSAHDVDDLARLLDRVEARDIRSFILPAGWDRENARLAKLGVRCPLYRHQRGPVTFATSIFGIENLIFLFHDDPDLAARLRDAIGTAMLAIARVLDQEAGYTEASAPRGFSFADDNCALLSPELYVFFGRPILERVFARYAPAPTDTRFQHSDSAMGHLLPLLSVLDLTGVNFGPTLPVAEIRAYCPRAVIYGQLAPFTFSRDQQVNMVVELLRDFEMSREQHGVVFTTAGSINDGSRLTGMRLLMAAIQRHARYDV